MTKTDDINSYRQRTLGTTFRGDIRTIATLALFWKSKSEPLRSLNEVLRITLEGMKDLILDKHPEFEVNTVTLGVEILTELGLISLKDQQINRTVLLKELSLESLTLEGIDPTDKLLKKLKHEKTDLGPFASQHEKDKLVKELEKQMEVKVVIPEDFKEQQEELGKEPEDD